MRGSCARPSASALPFPRSACVPKLWTITVLAIGSSLLNQGSLWLSSLRHGYGPGWSGLSPGFGSARTLQRLCRRVFAGSGGTLPARRPLPHPMGSFFMSPPLAPSLLSMQSAASCTRLACTVKLLQSRCCREPRLRLRQTRRRRPACACRRRLSLSRGSGRSSLLARRCFAQSSASGRLLAPLTPSSPASEWCSP